MEIFILSLIKRSTILDLFDEVKNIYTIYRYTHFGETYTEYPVTFLNKYIRGLKIIGGDNGELVCAGLYSEIFRSGIRGTFYFRIDPVNGKFTTAIFMILMKI
ncbi:MAG: hypothetical protein HC906_12945 [Bacteroidales bacterium]|nr:hypothetical protein [Bacteroidales bacterium]